MATNFPGSLDSFTNPTSSDSLNTPAVIHHEQHANANDAITALETKVGIDGSANTNSIDYKINNIDADNITSGTVDPERLGSGTPDNTTFLRGDSSWQTVSTGGISGSGSTNQVAKFTGATAIGDSQITDNGLNLSASVASGAAASGATPATAAGTVAFTGGTGGAASTTSGGVGSVGGNVTITAGTGGVAAASTNAGRTGGTASLIGGNGGAGTAGRLPGLGGNISILSGNAGADGGAGGTFGGEVNIDCGTASGVSSNNSVKIGRTNASTLYIGHNSQASATRIEGGSGSFFFSGGGLTVSGLTQTNIHNGNGVANGAGTCIIGALTTTTNANSPGLSAGGTIFVTGYKGSDASGASTAGHGSDITIRTGLGGDASSTAGGHGGQGGALSIVSGAGAAANASGGFAGNGGTVTFQSGQGGNGSAGRAGGSGNPFKMYGGIGGTNVGAGAGNGSYMKLKAGTGGAAVGMGNVPGDGGDLILYSGAGGFNFSDYAYGVPGDITMTAGSGNVTITGSTARIQSANTYIGMQQANVLESCYQNLVGTQYSTQRTVRWTAVTNNVAANLFNVYVPNGAGGAMVRITLTATLGDGDSTQCSMYTLALSRVAGTHMKAVLSSQSIIAATVGATANCTGVLSVVLNNEGTTVTETATIQVTIARSAGASDNHLGMCECQVITPFYSAALSPEEGIRIV